MFKEESVTFDYGNNHLKISTGKIARQADAAVMVDMDDTQVLVTLVARKKTEEGKDFFPLTINYQEKTYAAGQIPGSFFKREGRPSENETLTSRLIDRPLRPLFAKGFTNEVQIIATVVSLNKEINPDVPAMIGAAAVCSLSGLPFSGPLGCARVGYINEEFTLNPTYTQMEQSQLDLMVAGTKDAVLMVESEANLLSEQIMLDAVMFGHEQAQNVVNAIDDLTQKAGKEKWDWVAPAENTELKTKISDKFADKMTEGYGIKDKLKRQQFLSDLHADITTELESDDSNRAEIVNMCHKIEKEIVRKTVLDGNPRIDGRAVDVVRPIEVEVGVLSRTHGSALFTRGETQALVVTTLGTKRDSQIIDDLAGTYREKFLLHYNFPPYCVGETGFVGSPKRREIGHGKLAKRGILAVMPNMEDFPYTIRVVSEITESNGSSSMASVCGSSLALMDAGVPLTDAVSGIAMGLIKEGDNYQVLTDIMGDEDHLGDMDFKVAGTKDGISALQMDIKIQGITKEIMAKALEQAKVGRLHILDKMSEALSKPKAEVSEYAPCFMTVAIDPEKKGTVIGKGGSTIKALTEESGATIDIDDDGIVSVSCEDREAAEAVCEKIKLLTADVEVGAIYEGKVQKIMDFGAFVNVLPGKDGLVHISQISAEHVKNVNDVLKEGDTVKVKVLEVDRQGRIRLSMKEV
ncbi:MAG: polyribonucleotide nucleotidyltransferase [Gammaproteobacteria bacterium]|nr:MAG: polyribonucleotide nucleotidyltransferase [Gammaproteobacteria bacterium]